MYVINRSGQREEFDFSKTKAKLLSLSDDLCVNNDRLTLKVIKMISDGVQTRDIDIITIQECVSEYEVTFEHDYLTLASRILRDDIDRTYPPFEKYLESSNLRDDIKNKMREYSYVLTKWDVTLIGLHILMDIHLLRVNDVVIEKPEYMLLRSACEISDDVPKTFNMLREGRIMLATPIMANSGCRNPQLGSCYLLDMQNDIPSILSSKLESCLISNSGGGIGMNLNRIKPNGTIINATQRKTAGLVPLLESLNKDLLLVCQSGVKRNSSIAVYLSPWHGDFMDFIKARNENSTVDAKKLFYALWIPDEFMKRVMNDEDWWFTDEDLSDFWGDDFSQRYNKCNQLKRIKALDVWKTILLEQCGARPSMYVMFSDNVNKSSNVREIGPILSSNLCCEIVEVSNADQTAVCNLASVVLSKCVVNGRFNDKLLKESCYECVRCLNKTIHNGHYVNDKTRSSNLSLRPIGIGMQGVHDTFVELDIEFDSDEAKRLMFHISEVMYYASLKESNRLISKYGKHKLFEKTDLAKGVFHWEHYELEYPLTQKWDKLRSKVMQGVCNAQLIALMPTATTADVGSNSPCFEPYTSLIYKRRLQKRECLVVIEKFYRTLKSKGWLTSKLLEHIKRTGSLPEWFKYDGVSFNVDNEKLHFQKLFMTAYENPDIILKMAEIRQPMVDQSQSTNWFLNKPTPSLLNQMYFKSWSQGQKTGSYYINKSSNKKEPVCISCIL